MSSIRKKGLLISKAGKQPSVTAILLCLLAGIVLTATPATVHAQGVDVDSAALNAALLSGAGGSFNLTEDCLLDQEYIIAANTTINGNGHVIRAYDGVLNLDYYGYFYLNTTSRHFTVNAGASLTLNNVTIRDGGLSEELSYGGAIYNNGTLNVTGSTFENNGLQGFGAAIYTGSTGTLNVMNSTFQGNFAANGALGGGTGGAIYNDGTLTVIDSEFMSNVNAGDGSAIYTSGNSAITGTIFSDNEAEIGDNTTIYIDDSANNSIIVVVSDNVFTNYDSTHLDYTIYFDHTTNVTVSGNEFTDTRNGIYNKYGSMTVTGNTFTNNKDDCIINYGGIMTVTDNTFTGNGTGIVSSGSLTVSGSVFTGNTTGIGGSGSMDVTDCLFSDNASLGPLGTRHDNYGNLIIEKTGANSGGAMWIGVGSVSVTVTNSTFNNNSASLAGSAIYAVFGNTDVNLEITGCQFNGNSGLGYAIDIRTGTVKNSTFRGNQGAIVIYRGLIDNCIFEDNVTNGYKGGGGAIYSSGAYGLDILNSRFSNNTCTDCSGGAIYASCYFSYYYPVNIMGNSFNGNSATGSGDGDGNGGAIYTGGFEIYVSNNTFSGNSAERNGGAIYTPSCAEGSITMDNNTFSGNSAGNSGGAIGDVFNTVYMSNNTLSGNSAGVSGGAIFSEYTTDMHFANNIIVNNTSPTGRNCKIAGFRPGYGPNFTGLNIIDDDTCTTDTSVWLDADPLLSPLANNGGPTQTMALNAGSPAIDAVPDGTCITSHAYTNTAGYDPNDPDQFVTNPLTTDQRDYARPYGAACDIGAFERQDMNVTTYTLTYTSVSNGFIAGNSPQKVNDGEDGSAVTAAPDKSYHFVRWSDGVTDNPRQDTNLTADITVTAEFAVNVATYTLIYTPGANGSITGTSPQTVNHGTDGALVTATADTGYHFVQWSDGVAANPRTDTKVLVDISVTAEFAIDTFTLTYTAGANGSITGTSPQTVNHGGDGSAVTAVADTGYHFVQWSDGSTANPRADTNVTTNITATASFAINTYTLTYTAGTNGTLTGASPQTVNHGVDGTAVTAVPDADYHFVQWSDGSTANPRADTNVTTDITVTAEFAANTIQKGDINNDETLDLADAVLALQIAVGIDPSQDVYKTADVNGDERIGVEEAIYILQKVVETRE